MKKIFATLSLTIVSGAAVAADIPNRKTVEAPTPLPIFTKNWTGFYAGVHGGYAFSRIKGRTLAFDGPREAAAVESANNRSESFAGGVQAGYNYQYANGLVTGIELDLTALSNKASSTDIATAQRYFGQIQSTIQYKQDWLATARIRFGYAFGSVLVYGAGGLAALNETETRTQYAPDRPSRTTFIDFAERDSRVRIGWALGAGAEWAFANNWSVKAEYIYSHFTAEKFSFPNARRGVGNDNYSEVIGRFAHNRSDLQLLRFGLNYRF